MKAKTYRLRFWTYFADSNSQPSITLSFTYATNEYCKDEPCEGNLETLSLLYNQLITLFVCLSVFLRERKREREKDYLMRLTFHHTDPPTPTHCMMNKGNSSQYITREKKTDDGCQEINKGL